MRTSTIRRTAAMAAVTATALGALTACGGTESTDAEGSSKDDNAQSSGSGDKGSSDDPEILDLGEAAGTSVTVVEDGQEAQFQVTMEKIVKGKHEDLKELSGDKAKREGMVPVWLYATYKHQGGAAPVEPVTVDARMMTTAMEPAQLLVTIDELSARPEDCTKISDLTFNKGDSKTVCKAFLVPEGEKVDRVLLPTDRNLTDLITWYNE